MTLIGEVRAADGTVMASDFVVLPEQVLEGVAWMRCPECLGDPRGYRMPDSTFSSVPCVMCRGRCTVPVMA